MKIYRLVFLIFAFIGSAFGACHVVTAAGSGAHTGADWNNAFTKLPATLVRGDTYYLADGSYGSYTFNTAGTTAISILKATGASGTPGPHCTDTGWVQSTMGSSSAKFTQWSEGASSGGHYTLTGVFGGFDGTKLPTNGSFGICVSGSGSCTSGSTCNLGQLSRYVQLDSVDSGSAYNSVTFSFVELMGTGATSTANTNTPDDLVYYGGSSNLTLDHMYMHDSSCDFTFGYGSTNLTVQYSYFYKNWGAGGAGACHGQVAWNGNTHTGMVWRYNTFRTIEGTAVITAAAAGGGTSLSGMQMYGNTFYWGGTADKTGYQCLGNGLISCVNAGVSCSAIKFYNNTIVGFPPDNSNGGPASCGASGAGFYEDGSATWSGLAYENNLWYGNTTSSTAAGAIASVTQDHNSWLNNGDSAAGTANVINAGAANPFLLWTGSGNLDAHLTADSANVNNWLSLASPFNLDPDNVTRTTDRGAYQFGGAAPPTFTISGTVSAGVGSASPNPGVTVSCPACSPTSTTTDGAGAYSFGSENGGGNYVLTPSKTGYTFSPVSTTFNNLSANQTANFTAFQPPVPSCSPSGGSFKSGRLISCSDAVSAATICWRIGSPPTTNGNGTCTAGTTYTAPFMISSTGTLFVKGTQSGNTDSSTSYSFTINPTWTTGWIMNSPGVGRTTFGGNGISWLGATRIDVVQPPATPDFGGLTKNNIIRQDTSFGLPSPPDIARCTDANFDSGLLNRTFAAGLTGSGSANGMWNANSTALRIENTGGSAYLTIFDPVAMTCGARLTPQVGAGAFDWNDATVWYNATGKIQRDTIDFTARTLTAGAFIADFSLAVPLGSNVQPWVTGTVYPAGSYVSKVYPAPDWIANKADYAVGDIIQPSTGNPQNCAFKLSGTGTTAASAHTGTFWSNTNCVSASNSVLTDGTAKWRNLGGPPGFVYQLKSCVAPCTSGATFTLPSHPDLNTTVNDGALTWTNVGPNSTFLSNSFAGVSRDGTRFCTSGSTNEYGFEGDYTFQGGQDSGQWVVCYNITTNEYTLLNTATGWQSKTTCSGGTGFDCSGGTITLNPVGQSTPMASCGLFSHNIKGSIGLDYIVVTHNNNVPTGCTGAGALAFWSPFQTFNSTTSYQGFSGLAPNHWAPGHHTLVNIGQNTGILGGFTAGAYSEIADFTNPAAAYTTSWQQPCGALPLPSCSFGAEYDQHMGWAYNPNDTDDTPVCGTVYNLQTNSPIPVAPWQAEEVCVSTTPRWSDTANPNAAQKQYRFTHTFCSGTNTAFSVQFCVSEEATDGRFMAFGSDWMCSLGNTAGTGTTLCGLQWRTNTVYQFGVNGTMVNPFSNNNGSGTNFGVWRVTTAGNLNGLSGTAPDWTPGALTCNTANAGITTLDGNNVQYTCLGSSNARGDVFVVRLRR
jgi:hypothetical protein